MGGEIMSKRVSEILLDIEAVKIQPNDPFTWASGIKSPIYCDNRKTIGFPKERKELITLFIEKIKENYSDVEVIAGTATAGIPHAAFLAAGLDLPMVYVRGEKKKHGAGKQIEGGDVEGKKVILIEDLFSTGGSSLKAADALKEAGAEVISVMSVFSYELDVLKENFEAAGLEYASLSTIDEMLELCEETNRLSEADIEVVKNFRDNL